MCPSFLSSLTLILVLLPVAMLFAWPVSRLILRGAGGVGGVIRGIQLFLIGSAVWFGHLAFAGPAPSVCVADPVASPVSIVLPLAGLAATAACVRWYRLVGRQRLRGTAAAPNDALVRARAAHDRREAERAEFDAIVTNPVTAPEPHPSVLQGPTIEQVRTTVANVLALAAAEQGINPHTVTAEIFERTERIMMQLMGPGYAAGNRAIEAAGVTLAAAAAIAFKSVTA